MSGLQIVRIAVDPRALAAFAIAEGIDDDDRGYALHLALRRRFGAAAPQPFRFFEVGPSGAHMLGYAASCGALADAANLPSLGSSPVFPTAPECKPMPERWRPGARYAFEVRVRPVVRYGGRMRAARAAREGAWQPRAGEVDAFVAACERANGAAVDREAVYRDWLVRRLAGAAEIETAGLRLMRRIRTRRSTHRGGTRRVESPEALFGGILTVADETAFARLLARGIGRHTAFGFGMVILAPPGRS